MLHNYDTRQKNYRLHRCATGTEVFCDCDGTINRVDAADAVLETFALPVWRAWEQRWMNGLITIQKFLSRRIELIRADRDTRIKFAVDLAIDEDIITPDRRCAEHGT